MHAGLDADEFVATFVRHGRALWLLASAWVGRADAQDLVQEAARIGWQRRRHVAAGSDVAAWLAQIVRHTGANWRRKRRPAASDPCELPHPLARDEMPGHHDERTAVAAAMALPDELARALAALPEAARASLLLHAVGGLTFAEVAAMLGIPENTAASHARRARLALRAAMPAGVAPRAAPQHAGRPSPDPPSTPTAPTVPTAPELP
jgi:RNA polymerase sigma-70 factor (ECF subfamily)